MEARIEASGIVRPVVFRGHLGREPPVPCDQVLSSIKRWHYQVPPLPREAEKAASGCLTRQNSNPWGPLLCPLRSPLRA